MMRIASKPTAEVTLIAAGAPLSLHAAVEEIGRDWFSPMYLSAHSLDERCAYAVRLTATDRYEPTMVAVFERHGCIAMATDGAWGERQVSQIVTGVARARGELRGKWRG